MSKRNDLILLISRINTDRYFARLFDLDEVHDLLERAQKEALALVLTTPDLVEYVYTRMGHGKSVEDALRELPVKAFHPGMEEA